MFSLLGFQAYSCFMVFAFHVFGGQDGLKHPISCAVACVRCACDCMPPACWVGVKEVLCCGVNATYGASSSKGALFDRLRVLGPVLC